MHEGFRNKPGNQTNNYVPNKMKHISSFEPCDSAVRAQAYQPGTPEAMQKI